MKREVGLWIDHTKTVMVTVENEVEVTREIHSNVEKHMNLSPSLPTKKLNAATMATAEDVRDRRYGNHLNGYYDGVVSMLRNADSVWIIGPGEAKVELKKRLDHEALSGRVVNMETVDKMTDRQIAATIHQHFQR